MFDFDWLGKGGPSIAVGDPSVFKGGPSVGIMGFLGIGDPL